MKANKFVKNYGASRAKNELSMFEPQLSECFGDKFVSEIKRLIESHEVVERFGGLVLAKKFYSENYMAVCDAVILKRAIADVESCM